MKFTRRIVAVFGMAALAIGISVFAEDDQNSEQDSADAKQTPTPPAVVDTTGMVLVMVVDAKGKPVAGAQVFYVDKKNESNCQQALTDEQGKAYLTPLAKSRAIVAFCAHPDYCSFEKNLPSPEKPFKIVLKSKKGVGSVLWTEGGGAIPGLEGELGLRAASNVQEVMFLDGENMEFNGENKPTVINLKQAIKAQDQNGTEMGLRIIAMVGEIILVEYMAK